MRVAGGGTGPMGRGRGGKGEEGRGGVNVLALGQDGVTGLRRPPYQTDDMMRRIRCIYRDRQQELLYDI